MRVNPDLNNEMLSGVSLNRQQMDGALSQLSTGRKVNEPSDDPAAVASLIETNTQAGQVDSYLNNVSNLRSAMQVADSTLSSVVSDLTKAIAFAVQGGNDILSQPDRDAIAAGVDGIRQEILSYGNQSYEGKYLFGGTAVNEPAFVPDPASPSGVRYQGNEGVNSVEIGAGQAVAANLPGSQLLTSPRADVFSALAHLSGAMKSGSAPDIRRAEQEVQKAFDYVNTQRSFYGVTLSRLDTAEAFLNEENIQLSETESNLTAADMAAAATHVTQAQVGLQATLAAGSKISSLNLFDYLK